METQKNINKITIIVVEDDIGLNHLISGKVKDLGYICVSAYNMDDAKTLILNNNFCFVLLDYSLGNRFSSELVKDLLEQGIKFPYIILTGYSDTKLAVEFMKLGAYDFIVKSGSFLDEIEIVLLKSINLYITEKLNLELQYRLLKSEKLYRLMADNMYDIVCKHELSGEFTYVSPSVKAILGYNPIDLLGKHPISFVHPEDLAIFNTEVVLAIKERKQWNIQYRFIKSDFEYLWVETSGAFIIENNSISSEIQTVTRNINDRVIAEFRLKQSEKQFRAAFEFAAVGMSLRSLEGEIIVANNALCAMLGYSKTELEGKYFTEITHKDDLHLTASFIGKEPELLTYQVEKRYIHKNGSIVWASVSSNILSDETNKPLYFIAQIQNITEQKKAEEISKLDEARLESLLRIYEFQTNEVSDLLDFTLEEVIKLTKSKIGYIYNYNEELQQFALNSWSKNVMQECSVLEQQTVCELEKTGLWGEAVRQKKPIIVNDFSAPNKLKKGNPEGHAHLKRFLSIPVFYGNKIVAVVGVANKETDYDEKDVRQLNLMMDSVWEISMRKKTEYELASRLEMEELIAQISTEFVTNITDNIDSAITFVLSRIGTITNADRAYIYISENNKEINNTHEWHKTGDVSFKNKTQHLQISNFAWWSEKIYSGETINVSSFNDIPKSAVNEREFLKKFGIKSQLFVPLIYAGNPIGIIGVSALERPIIWNSRDIDFLRTVSSIVASALNNSAVSYALKSSEKRYRKLFDRLPDIVIMHHDGVITYANEAAITNLGFSKNELVGSEIFSHILESDSEIKKVLLGKYSGNELGTIEVHVKSKNALKICIVRTEIVTIENKLLTLVLLSDITTRKELENKVARNINKQSVLNSLLKLSLERLSLDKLLVTAFDMLMSVSWITFEKRGCLFLLNDEGNLEMKIQSNLISNVCVICEVIPFGKCLCGQAAISKKIIYSNHILPDNDVICDQNIPHGHYCVPIIFNENILGVINIYLDDKHNESNEEREFLTACANTIAGLIARKKSETELINTLENLEDTVKIRTEQITTSNLSLMEEIEQRKMIAQALSVSEEKFKTIVEQSVYGIYIGDPKGNFISANPKGCELSGYSLEEILSMNMNDFFTLEERQRVPLRYDLLDKGETVISERNLLRKDGSTCFVEMSTRKMTDGTYQAVFKDITLQKKAEEEIKIALEKEQELNSLKSRFISLVSHEFRTPLAGILLSVELLEKYSDKWNVQRKKEQFKKIYNSIKYTNLLLDDVSLIGKDDLGKLEYCPSEFNLRNLCYNTLEDAKAVVRNSEVKITEHIADNINTVFLDESLVRHIITNLLTNALKYSPEGKNVNFIVEKIKSKLNIIVSDEGIGIPEEDMKNIFERFHRAKNVSNIKGTGLGLSIVKRSVDLMSGTIRIESMVGVGTTVYVELPEKLKGKS